MSEQSAHPPYRLVLLFELDESEPGIWRRVEVPSWLWLDQLHDVVQALFGWRDYHLHRFASGTSVWDATEVFLCLSDVEEGEDEGTPEVEVRLDQLLTTIGDELHYVYDYGDEWQLRIVVEGVEPGELDRPRVLGGEGLAPPEDSGGIWTWNEERPTGELDLAHVVTAVERVAKKWSR